MSKQAIYDHRYRQRGATTTRRKSVGRHAAVIDKRIADTLAGIDDEQRRRGRAWTQNGTTD